MSNQNTAEIIKNLTNGKSLNVHIVNPPVENPWATRQDYLDDQKRITTAQRWTIASSLTAIITALCTVVMVAKTYRDLPLPMSPPKLEQVAPSLPLKIESTIPKDNQRFNGTVPFECVNLITKP